MEFRNDYTDDQNYTHIDYWETDNDSEEGRTVAIVCLDTSKVYYIDSAFSLNTLCQEAVDEVLKRITSTENRGPKREYMISYLSSLLLDDLGTGNIELNNLDRAKLIDYYGDVKVENEHGTVYDLEDLSTGELEIFWMNN